MSEAWADAARWAQLVLPAVTELEQRQLEGNHDAGRPGRALVPVTVQQLLMAERPDDADPLCIDGRPVYLASLLCRVRSTKGASDGSIEYILEDHTGRLLGVESNTVVEYPQATMGSATTSTPSINATAGGTALVGQLTTVIGKPRVFNGQRRLDIDGIRTVQDSNELTVHLLAVIEAHLYSQRGLPPANCSQLHEDSQHTTGDESKYHTQMLTEMQRLVLDVCCDAPEAGLHFGQIMAVLQADCDTNPEEIQATLQWLSCEGLVYTTTSDQHWRAESSNAT